MQTKMVADIREAFGIMTVGGPDVLGPLADVVASDDA
jgi:hypothetical protein